jgi:hypothetical protein
MKFVNSSDPLPIVSDNKFSMQLDFAGYYPFPRTIERAFIAATIFWRTIIEETTNLAGV